MPNHSIKKKRNQQSNITIDEKHTQVLDEFQAIETETVPDLEMRKTALKTQLGNLSEEAIDIRMELKDQIRDLSGFAGASWFPRSQAPVQDCSNSCLCVLDHPRALCVFRHVCPGAVLE